jgi:hypothetical protein
MRCWRCSTAWMRSRRSCCWSRANANVSRAVCTPGWSPRAKRAASARSQVRPSSEVDGVAVLPADETFGDHAVELLRRGPQEPVDVQEPGGLVLQAQLRPADRLERLQGAQAPGQREEAARQLRPERAANR